MPANYGSKSASRPAVYNEKSSGTSPGDGGIISDLQASDEAKTVTSQVNSGQQASDTQGTSATHNSQTQTDLPLRVGTVLLAFPYVHCYKIQLSGRQGMCIATALTRSSLTPIGVKESDVIPAGSSVIVWQPKDSSIAYILGVVPSPTTDDAMNLSDHIQQGGNSGPKKVEAYRHVVKTPTDAMGWKPQSSGRPMDGTAGEYVRMSETGIGLLIDSFQAYLRVNEACGLWLNYFDNYAKLSALSLNLMSYCESNIQTYDEGELFSLKGYATYPWETTGMYKDGEKFSKTNGEDIQLDKEQPFGLEDVQDYAQTPVFRLTDYTGYIGQGFNRTLMKPAKDSGVRKMSDAEADKDDGLFQELVALDGSYSVRSAKQILFSKYPAIPNPRRRRSNEDGKGDDKEYGGEYKFSGKFGSGDPHIVRDWDDSEETEQPALLRTAGILDLISHHYNWKSTHPFFYHTKDYAYPEESELGANVQYLSGEFSKSYVNETATTRNLKIDDRYQDVKYFNTASYFSLLEDGGVVIADGYGSQITMTGGQIRLEAGGDLIVASGSRVVTLAKEAIIRTKDSVDISSSDKDVRIKAEKNLQMLGGNAGSGGVLIESKGRGTQQNYAKKLGEKVQPSGIVLLSKGGVVATLASTVYTRSGITKSGEGRGSIITDSAKGKGGVISYGQIHTFFQSSGVGMWHPPTGEAGTITEAHYFSKSFSFIQGPTLMDKTVAVLEGHLGVQKSILALGYGIYGNRLACLGAWPKIGDTKKIIPELVAWFEPLKEIKPKLVEIGKVYFNAYFPNFIWKPKQPGNTKLVSDEIGFSYRDDSDEEDTVYGYSEDSFWFLETRWQQLRRTGLATGSQQTWQEKAVEYQGKQLHPWPGRKNWEDREAFLKYENQGGFLLYDTAGYAKDRKANQSDYEEPKFSAFQKAACNSEFKV